MLTILEAKYYLIKFNEFKFFFDIWVICFKFNLLFYLRKNKNNIKKTRSNIIRLKLPDFVYNKKNFIITLFTFFIRKE